jgi:hypothetical protein
MMPTVRVQGSKNGFAFGPDELQIPDGLDAEQEQDAVVDALLQAEDTDAVEGVLSDTVRQRRNALESPRDRAVHWGLTKLTYQRSGSPPVRIV